MLGGEFVRVICSGYCGWLGDVLWVYVCGVVPLGLVTYKSHEQRSILQEQCFS